MRSTFHFLWIIVARYHVYTCCRPSCRGSWQICKAYARSFGNWNGLLSARPLLRSGNTHLLLSVRFQKKGFLQLDWNSDVAARPPNSKHISASSLHSHPSRLLSSFGKSWQHRQPRARVRLDQELGFWGTLRKHMGDEIKTVRLNTVLGLSFQVILLLLNWWCKSCCYLLCLQQDGSVVASYQKGVSFFCFVFCFTVSQKLWMCMAWLASHQLAINRTCQNGHNLLADQYWNWSARSGKLRISFKTWWDISSLQCQSALFQLCLMAWCVVWDPWERVSWAPFIACHRKHWLNGWVVTKGFHFAEPTSSDGEKNCWVWKSIGKTVHFYCSS